VKKPTTRHLAVQWGRFNHRVITLTIVAAGWSYRHHNGRRYLTAWGANREATRRNTTA